MRNANVARMVFATTLVATGLAGLASGGFATVLPPGAPAREALARLCAAVLLGCGLGLAWRRTAATAAWVLVAGLALWMLAINAPVIVRSPLVEGAYQSWGETAVVLAAALALAAGFTGARPVAASGMVAGARVPRGARVIYALALMAFGLSHFAYLDLTAPLVPAWLPWRTGWAYFFGGTYLAAGVGLLVGVCARLAAALSALQMGLFTLLVWLPLVGAGHVAAGQWSEFADSSVLTAAAWVVAEAYRGEPWLAVRWRWPGRASASRPRA